MTDIEYEHVCEGWCQCRCGNHECGCACGQDAEAAPCGPGLDWSGFGAAPLSSWGSHVADLLAPVEDAKKPPGRA